MSGSTQGHDSLRNGHDRPGLRKSLQSRHVAMISIGGIIGFGLFIGSSAAIAAVGPAIVVSYFLAGVLVLFVMRMLAEMAATSPETGSFVRIDPDGHRGHCALICKRVPAASGCSPIADTDGARLNCV